MTAKTQSWLRAGIKFLKWFLALIILAFVILAGLWHWFIWRPALEAEIEDERLQHLEREQRRQTQINEMLKQPPPDQLNP